MEIQLFAVDGSVRTFFDVIVAPDETVALRLE